MSGTVVRTTHQEKRHKALWDLYIKQRTSLWFPEEVDLSLDCNDLKKMPAEWQHFVKFLCAFFAVSDALVNVNIEDRLKYFVDKYASKYKMELNYNWHFQEAMEDIHAEQYSLLLETYCADEEEKKKYINCIENFSTIKEKANFILSIDEEKYQHNPLYIVVASACVERISFSASFAGVFWFSSMNLLPGLVAANSLIIKDEGIHCDINTTLFNQLVEDDPSLLNPEVIREIENIVRNACDIEKRFAEEALPKNLPNMNASLMKQYVEYIGDNLLNAIGLGNIYNTENPFEFMNNISLQTKTSFFEKTSLEYKKVSSGREVVAGGKFVMDDEI